jgi:hypothetical protein
MQQHDVTERRMEDMLQMLQTPPFGDDTIAKSAHVLTEAGQVRPLLIFVCVSFIVYLYERSDDVPNGFTSPGLRRSGDARLCVSDRRNT